MEIRILGHAGCRKFSGRNVQRVFCHYPFAHNQIATAKRDPIAFLLLNLRLVDAIDPPKVQPRAAFPC